MNLLRTATMLVALTTFFHVPAHAQQGEDLLGTTLSQPRVEQSIIKVGKKEGRYQAVRLAVSKNDAQIIDLKVIYGNGQSESISVKQVFRAGQSSRSIPVKGGDRYIDQIVVTYLALGPVQIQMFGQPTPVARWAELGCRSVGFLVDRDVIKLQPRSGAFKALKLRVIGNRIEVFNMRVVYGNGAPDDIPVRAIIPDRGETQALQLRGDQRNIDRVELIYRSQPNFKGQAAVCVDGLQVMN